MLGARLIRDDTTGRREALIVEVEAYGGPEDRASHARFASTARNRVMAGPPGFAYVYLVYGMYDCLNVVTEPAGRPSAVLIRAVEPLLGIERMRADRLAWDRRRRAGRTEAGAAAARLRLDRTPDHRLASGPGLVGATFGLDTAWTGMDLCDPASPLRLEVDPADRLDPAEPADPPDRLDPAEPADPPGPAAIGAPDRVAVGTRVGVAYAGEAWAARPWRFAIAGHRSVSGPASAWRHSGQPPTVPPAALPTD